jgi:tetratricopeptide (TPR) repeat protein
VWRSLHAAAAQLLLADLSVLKGGLPWDSAEHWRLAGNDLEAINVLRACAQHSFEIGRPNDALATYERALALKASNEVRFELLQSALKTIWRGLNYRQASQLLEEFTRLRLNLGAPATVHDEYEILAFAQTLHSDQDPRHNIPRLLECITSTEATDYHRGAAACQLLMIADLAKDLELAEFAFGSTLNLSAEGVHRDLAHLEYHTCFGSAKNAKALADAFPRRVVGDIPREVGSLINAGYAYVRIGRAVEARSTLLRALGGARSNNLISAEIYALLFLGQLCWNTQSLDECKEWYRTLSELLAHHGDAAPVICDYALLGARLALSDQEFRRAEELIERLRDCPQAQLASPRMQLLSCQLDLARAAGLNRDSDQDVAELLALHAGAKSLGGQDEIVLTLWHELRARDRHNEAAELLAVYATVRRHDYPIRTELSGRETSPNSPHSVLVPVTT